MWLSMGLTGVALAWVPDRVTNLRTNRDYGTVQEAITAATAGDRLWVDGVYDEHVVVDRDVYLVGTGEVHWDGGGEVISLNAGVQFVLFDLLITSTSNRAISGEGANALVVQRATFRTSSTSSGGAIQLTEPFDVGITGALFDGTSAGLNGGAVHVSGSTPFLMDFVDTTFRGTRAGNNGGAVFLDTATFSCTRCVFEATSAGNGGAIYDGGDSSITVLDSTFTGTTAIGSGGGIAVSSSTTDLIVERTGFCGSSGALGGSIAGNPVSATVRASTFVEGSGGALNATGGSWTVHNNHFLGVSGTAVVDVSGGSTMDVVNDLFLASPGTALRASAASVTVEFSDFRGNTVAYQGVNAGLGILNVNPALRDWTADGDCTNDDLRPDWGSPLIDSGSSDPAFSDPDGSRSDIGAFGGPACDPANHADDDGDGFTFFHGDCDDAEASAHLGHAEECDGVDNDCDGSVDVNAIDPDSFYLDCDGDAQGDVATRVDQCDPPAAVPGCDWLSYQHDREDAWSDCDDTDPAIYWGAVEMCDDADRNCDGDPYLGAANAQLWYYDLDDDTWGGAEYYTCRVPGQGFVQRGGDCNDDTTPLAAATHPQAPDPCDGSGVDTNCDGLNGDDSNLRDWYPDEDADGYGDPDGAVVRACEDLSTGGKTDLAGATDCDDALDTVHPGATEECNFLDDDCNDAVDDKDGPEVEWYEDRDLDGYGDRAFSASGVCPPQEGLVAQGLDCNDDNVAVNPDADELCNRVDDDCDDLVDADDADAEDTVGMWPDADEDGFGACDDGSSGCDPEPLCEYEVGEGWSDNALDCDDALDTVHPDAVDVPGDDLDQDCSGSAEPGRDPDPDPDPKGCGCDAAPGAPGLAGLVVPGLLVALRRRRSSFAR